MSRACRSMIIVIVAACGTSSDAPPAVDPPRAAPDAGDDRVARTGDHDPQAALHFVDDVPRSPDRPAPRRAGRTIDIMLRSTPSGATVHVDGAPIGDTPTMWSGPTGEHEFTFVLPRHALARYRFHAITTGVVHARLDPVAEERDPGTPPPEVVRPTAPPLVPPAPTIVTPDANVRVSPVVVPPIVAPTMDPAPAPVGPQP